MEYEKGSITYEIEAGIFDPSKYVKRDFQEFLFENYIQRWLEFSETKLKPSTLKHRKRIAFTYGCRPGEARALCWDAVDFENELIRRSWSLPGAFRCEDHSPLWVAYGSEPRTCLFPLR